MEGEGVGGHRRQAEEQDRFERTGRGEMADETLQLLHGRGSGVGGWERENYSAINNMK